MYPMIEGCSPAVSEDKGHTSNVDGPESLAHELENYTASHSLPRGHAYQPSTVSYLVMSERYSIVRMMVSEHRGATLPVVSWSVFSSEIFYSQMDMSSFSIFDWLSIDWIIAK